MSKETDLILAEINKLSERMNTMEQNTVSGDERQDILGKMEELNEKLVESRAANTPNLMMSGTNGAHTFR